MSHFHISLPNIHPVSLYISSCLTSRLTQFQFHVSVDFTNNSTLYTFLEKKVSLTCDEYCVWGLTPSGLCNRYLGLSLIFSIFSLEGYISGVGDTLSHHICSLLLGNSFLGILSLSFLSDAHMVTVLGHFSDQ